MGTVYEAFQDGSKIALKSLNRCSGEQIYRFKQEFRLLADVSHPHVIQVRELFFENDRWFFTMELVDGWPIDRYVYGLAAANDGTPLALRSREYFEQVRFLFRQLVDGVAAVHRVGLIHRDLKPSNVVVETGGRVVILDFGLVSALSLGGIGQTIDGTIVGTPGYLAPELALRGTVTPAGDWYAVGVMLYELMTQQLPLRAAPAEFLTRIATEDPAPPASICADIPPDLNELCCALLQRDPARRPTTDQMVALCRSWQDRTQAVKMVERPVQATAGFIGREQLLRELTSSYRASAREAQLVFIDGVSGIGKSALLNHFSEHLQHLDRPVVLMARCHERERVPYKGLDAIIDAFTRRLLRLPTEQVAQLLPRRIGCLARIFPALLRVELFRKVAENEREPEDPNEQQRWAVEALREMFTRFADQHRLVLLIDDLHWSDSDGHSLLAEVLAPPKAPRMLVVATRNIARPRQAAPLSVQTSVRSFATHSFTLEPLAAEEARALALQLVAPDSAAAELIANESGGVPHFLLELAQHHRRGARHPHELSLAYLLAQRVDELTLEQRTALELVAVAVRPLAPSVLERALCGETDDSDMMGEAVAPVDAPPTRHPALAAEQAALAVDALRRQKLVASGDARGGLVLYHEQISRAVLGRLDAADTQSHYQTLISAMLASENPDAEALALLFEAVGDAAHAAALTLETTERAARALAFERAADLYAKTVELYGPREIPQQLYLKAAQASASCGRGPEAARLYLRLAQTTEPAQAAKLAAQAALQWARAGYVRDSASLLQGVLSQAGTRWPQYVRGTLLALGWRRRGAYFAAYALPMAVDAGDPERLLTTLAAEAVYCAMLGGSRAAQRIVRLRSDIRSTAARARDDAFTRGTIELANCITAYWEGRWEQVVEAATASEQHFREQAQNARWEANVVRSVRHAVQRQTGQLTDIGRELTMPLLEAHEKKDGHALLDLSRTAACLRLAADDLVALDAAHAEVRRVRAEYPAINLDYLLMSLDVSVALYRGDAVAARTQLHRHWRACRKSGVHRSPLCRVMTCGMRVDCALLDEGRSAQARASELRVLAKRIEREPVAFAPALGGSARATASALCGDRAAALSELAWSSEQFYGHAMHATAAGVALRIGALLGGADGEELCTRASAQLREMNIADPVRWTRIIHSMY